MGNKVGCGCETKDNEIEQQVLVREKFMQLLKLFLGYRNIGQIKTVQKLEKWRLEII